jgi:4-hydroxy-tetrahydrodipicolinate synthase
MFDSERADAISFAKERAAGRVPIIAGTGTNETVRAIELSKAAEKSGADALLVVTPYYNKTSQRGLVKYFYDVAAATNLPVIVYNVPSRTGLNIQPKTLAEIAKHPKIVGNKEAVRTSYR